jgi:superfamily II DNA or RNA helicase
VEPDEVLAKVAARLRQRPRRYQLEAARWALSRGRAVVVLPTGTGKTLVAVLWALALMEAGLAGRVVFLEPTRFLVEQVARYIRSVAGVEAEPVHGALPRGEKRRRWRGRVVVSTPEALVAEWSDATAAGGFDAVVVDECHHTTGKDAYKEAMRLLRGARYRLGLSAFIPRHRRGEIEETIGEIREWSWRDPEVAPYIPPLIGEVYEAVLNEEERRLYDALEELAGSVSGRLRALLRNAQRWFVRDGALALRDSLQRRTMLSALLGKVRGLIEAPGVRPSHKAEPFLRLLRDHEGFTKAIVFIDRVVVAEYACHLAEEHGYPCVLIRGRMPRGELRAAVERAHSRDVKVIVSTSAGEEGVDLPDADLLVMWSITASPLRFIQRHGRVLRARETGGPPKTVVYIVTLDTIDVDSFVDAMETAERIGIDMPVSREVVEALWRRTTRSRIVAVLEGNPMPLELLSEAAGMPLDRLRRNLQHLLRRGEVFYIYTGIGRVYAYRGDAEVVEERFAEYLSPEPGVSAKVKYMPLGSRSWGRAVTGEYPAVKERLLRLLERHGGFERIHAALEVETGGVVRLVNAVYAFLIEDEEVLDIVLRNIYSIPRIMRELGVLPT